MSNSNKNKIRLPTAGPFLDDLDHGHQIQWRIKKAWSESREYSEETARFYISLDELLPVPSSERILHETKM